MNKVGEHEILAFLDQVAEHFADTDAPLGVAARELAMRLRDVGPDDPCCTWSQVGKHFFHEAHCRNYKRGGSES